MFELGFRQWPCGHSLFCPPEALSPRSQQQQDITQLSSQYAGERTVLPHFLSKLHQFQFIPAKTFLVTRKELGKVEKIVEKICCRSRRDISRNALADGYICNFHKFWPFWQAKSNVLQLGENPNPSTPIAHPEKQKSLWSILGVKDRNNGYVNNNTCQWTGMGRCVRQWGGISTNYQSW